MDKTQNYHYQFFTSVKNMKVRLNRNIVIFALIFFILLIFRFYKVAEFFSFNFDEEYQANLAWEQVKNFHPIWIGVSASNVNYYLGPGFTYLNALLFKISQGDPVILGYFAVSTGIVTTASIYFVTKSLFSQKAALFAALFYLGSAFFNFYDRRFWNPLPIPFISIWLFYALVKAHTNKMLFIVIGMLIATALHVHLSLLVFLPVILFVMIKNIKTISWKVWSLMAGAYLFITSPLLIYDLNHNFDNLLFPLRFFQKTQDTEHSFTFTDLRNHLDSFITVMQRLWFLSFHTNIQTEHLLGPHMFPVRNYWPLWLLSLIILFWFFYQAYKNTKYRLLAVIYVLFIFAYLGYPGGTVEYFLLGFLTLFTIAVGLFLTRIPRPLSYTIMLVFLVSNILVITTSNQQEYGIMTRKKIINTIMDKVDGNTFYLETVGRDARKYHPYGGWRHLFRVYGRTPTQSNADDFFGWIYQNELTDVKPKLRVIISEDIPYKTDKKIIFQTKQGAYYGYILNF